MLVGLVHTARSACRCAEAVSEGLTALGHRMLRIDSEQIGCRAAELAERCDLVLDHTDTLRGEGLLRPYVRQLLEARGARLVGSAASACLLADDKPAAKDCLGAAGVPTAPGIVTASPGWTMPPWLRPPFVVKPAFGHMSRGVSVETDEIGARAAAARLQKQGLPALVERYLAGRELGVCVLQKEHELEVLPIVEWKLASADHSVLTAAYKLEEPPSDRADLGAAGLPPDECAEVGALARAAFRALGLRDYARFDVRLTPGGTPYFLEANVTPSLEPSEALSVAASLAGLDYPGLVARLLASASARVPQSPRASPTLLRVDLAGGPMELRVPAGVHVPPESTVELAHLLDVAPGETVLELGCGAGMLAVAAARLGARRVVAVDLDPRALEATAENARLNGVADRVEVRVGSWYEALPAGGDPFDVIVATPPQTPAPSPIGPRWGGPDGLRHLAPVIDGAAGVLRPQSGRLWLLNLSTANPVEVRRRLEGCFSTVSVVRESERRFDPREYEALGTGLFDHLLALRAEGRAQFDEIEPGRFAFRNTFLCARGPRRP